MTDIPKSEEQVDDLEEQIARGRKMQSLVNSDGWPILKGYLAGGKKGAFKSLTTATELPDFLRHQQAYNTILGIEMFVENEIDAGDAARKQLYPEKRQGEG